MAALWFAACCSNSTLVAAVGGGGGRLGLVVESPGRILATTRMPAVTAAAAAVSPPAQYSRFREAFEDAFCAEISCASRARAKWIDCSVGCSEGAISRTVSITSIGILLHSLLSWLALGIGFKRCQFAPHAVQPRADRKSTRLNSSHVAI